MMLRINKVEVIDKIHELLVVNQATLEKISLHFASIPQLREELSPRVILLVDRLLSMQFLHLQHLQLIVPSDVSFCTELLEAILGFLANHLIFKILRLQLLLLITTTLDISK